MVFTIGANGVLIFPITSVLLKIASRNLFINGFLDCAKWLLRARTIKSPIFTSDGQATSQRLQLVQYLSASS